MKREESERAAGLIEAQRNADLLFHAVSEQGIIRPGTLETAINEDVYALAERMFGISTYWHKRIVRAGHNTLAPYDENPPDLIVGDDDIVFLDFGPVFEEWEADFGRTFVLGSDPVQPLPKANNISRASQTSRPAACSVMRKSSRKDMAGNSAARSPGTC